MQQFVFTNVAQQLRNLADILDFRHTHDEILTYNVADLHKRHLEIDALKQRDRELNATVQSLREEAQSLNSNVYELKQQLRLQKEKFMEQIDSLQQANISLRQELTKMRTISQIDAASQEPKMLTKNLPQGPADTYGDARSVTRPKQIQYDKLIRDPRKPSTPPAPSRQRAGYNAKLYGIGRHDTVEPDVAMPGRDHVSIARSHEPARYRDGHRNGIAVGNARNGGLTRSNNMYNTFSTTRNAPQKSYPIVAAGHIAKRAQPQYRLRELTEGSHPKKLRKTSDWSRYASARVHADRALSGLQHYSHTSPHRRISSVVRPSASIFGSHQKRFRSDRGVHPNRRTLF